MGTHYGAVNQYIFQIRVLDTMSHQIFPHPIVTPAGKSLVDAVPVTILGWQQSPLGATAGYPHYAFHKATTLSFVGYVHVRASSQNARHLHPLIVSERYVCHEAIMPQILKCQQNLVLQL
jgi:hypothetical protein